MTRTFTSLSASRSTETLPNPNGGYVGLLFPPNSRRSMLVSTFGSKQTPSGQYHLPPYQTHVFLCTHGRDPHVCFTPLNSKPSTQPPPSTICGSCSSHMVSPPSPPSLSPRPAKRATLAWSSTGTSTLLWIARHPPSPRWPRPRNLWERPKAPTRTTRKAVCPTGLLSSMYRFSFCFIMKKYWETNVWLISAGMHSSIECQFGKLLFFPRNRIFTFWSYF